jgi:uncharacterized protein (DUF2237 family)
LFNVFVGMSQSKQVQPKNTTCGPVKETDPKKLQMETQQTNRGKNVLGTDLELCCNSPKTGYYRDGFCATGATDHGVHVVCAIVTDEFLQYSKARGNDLITPMEAYGFPGLKAGDKWCLCATRWREAFEAGLAPPIVLESTHAKALQFVSLAILKSKALPQTIK